MRLEGVHGDGAHEGDVHTEAAVVARAGEADEEAEFGGGPSKEGGGKRLEEVFGDEGWFNGTG